LLLKIGTDANLPSQPVETPIVLSDIFCRVGGANMSSIQQVSVDNMVEINTAGTIIDNAWLWRADHDVSGNGGAPVSGRKNPV
jgi:hypothetical protein